MKIPATLQPLIDATRRELPSLLKQLQVGQTLQAKVLAELQPGLLRLQIATTELLARSQLSATPGTMLKLQVVKGYPTPELRVLREPTPLDQQQRVVRSAMVRQMPPREVRQAAAELRSQTQTGTQGEAVRQLNSVLQQSGIKLTELGPAQLQRALTLSGLFHEAGLLSGQLPSTDTKLQLLQLLTRLHTEATASQRPTPPGPEQQAPAQQSGGDSLLNKLIRLVEGSVARIQLQQSTALPVDDSQRHAWQIDLPIHRGSETDDVKLRIERESKSGDTDADPAWAVNLAFQFDTIGTLQCRIGLAGERVATTFWCEQPGTRERLEQRLPSLKEALEAQGLEVVHLAGVLGEPAEPLIRVSLPDNLLDERA